MVPLAELKRRIDNNFYKMTIPYSGSALLEKKKTSPNHGGGGVGNWREKR